MSAAAPRLFLALWPTDETRSAIEAHAAAWSWPAQARRTRPERLHITLHFIGTVPAERLPELRSRLQVDWEDCELQLDRAEVWPGGIAVLEAGTVPSPLARLQARLGERLGALELPVEERRYRPHVTLARKATGGRPPAFPPLPWRARPGYALVQSLGGGAGYATLQAFA